MNISDCYCNKCGGSTRNEAEHPRGDSVHCLPGDRKSLVDAIQVVKTWVPAVPGAEVIAILKGRISSIDYTIEYNRKELERKRQEWLKSRR